MDVLISDYFLLAVAILWLIFASISDLKKREIANWLSFSLIAIALGIRAITSIITLDYGYFFSGLLFAFIFFILANLLYYTRIFAGGDAKLLIALGALLSTTPAFVSFENPLNLPFPSIFLLNVLIVASAYGILYSAGLALKNLEEFLNSFKNIYQKTKKLRTPLLIAVFFGLMFLLLSRHYELLFFIALIFLFQYLYIFVKSVENACMIKLVKAEDLTEGDWIISQIKAGRRIIMPSVEGLSKEDIILLRKYHKKVEVKYGIPFVPVFLIAIVVSLLFGNLFYVIARFLVSLF